MQRGNPAGGWPRRWSPSLFAITCTFFCTFICCTLVASAPAAAGVADEFICHITSDGPRAVSGAMAGRSHSSPLFDRQLIEEQSFSRPGKITGRGVKGLVAFTFDDGPKAESTPLIVAALEKYDIPAMFFAVGWRLEETKRGGAERRAQLKSTWEAGFDIGNHTLNHINLRTLPARAVATQIDTTATLIYEIIGHRPHAFRPPYGAASDTVRRHLGKLRMSEITWSVDTHDFWIASSEALRKRTMRALLEKGGGIVLLHDTKDRTAEAIPGILDDLEAENCRRLSAAKSPIIPVSLHYFMREADGSPAPVPAVVRVRTRRYVNALPARCAARKVAY